MTIYANLLEWLNAAWQTKHGDRPFVLKELCEGSGINPPNYYRLEKGNPELATLEKLADYFGVSVPERVVLARDLPAPPRTAVLDIRDAMRLLESAEASLMSVTPDGTNAGDAVRRLEELKRDTQARRQRQSGSA